MKSTLIFGLVLGVGISSVFLLNSCRTDDGEELTVAPPTLETSIFGTTKDGQEVRLFTLKNSNGYQAQVSEYGAILTAMHVPDREGNAADVTLGYDDLVGWEGNSAYFGATIGRVGNRIADGQFSLDGKDYQLAKNNSPGGIPCHLHGGEKGFDKVVWKGEPVEGPDATGVALTYLSKDGEEGYPGNLKVTVTYWLTNRNELIWQVRATTDAPTPVNVVHHTYWNLTADFEKPILDHVLQLKADQYLPTTPGMIPTSKLAEVAGTPMDFNEPTAIGERIDSDFEALKLGEGYDHCWVLGEASGSDDLVTAAIVTDPVSGRRMEVLTDQPGVQFYTANFLDGNPFARRTGFCLETQNFPDAPNQPGFPNSILRPGETYEHTLVHRFSTE